MTHDEERQPLLPKDPPKKAQKEKSISSVENVYLKICKAQGKQLLILLDMASMQSPRTQCCCCAIGVFAAMFGIFMLSAGICIVLNVNYMEVDTSGLPPDLHNEDGKRIVGIILICVAICTLGLSATVSIIYFAICNRSPRPHAAVSSSASPANQSNGNVRQSSKSHHHASKASVPKGASASARGTHPGSQSLNAGAKPRRHGPPASGDRVMVLAAGSSHGQSPSGQKRHKNNMSKVKNHARLRNKGYHFGLPTHTEEDPEAAKSVVDLKSHQRTSAETSSSSGSSMATSQLGSTITDENTHLSTTSFINMPTSGTVAKATPVITISDSTQNSPALPPSTDGELLPSSLGLQESKTEDNTLNDIQTCKSEHNDTDTVYHENEITKTTENVIPPSSSSPPNSSPSFPSSQPLISENSSKETQGFTNPTFQSDSNNAVPMSFARFGAGSTSDSQAMNDRFLASPPSTSGQQTAFPQYPQNDTTSPEAMIPSRFDLVDEREQLTDQDSVTSNHGILQVKPHHPSQANSDDMTTTTGDRLTDLPPSSRHHDRYKGPPINGNNTVDADTDNRSESRSSFNSAFSTDGDDPDKDVEKMQEKLRQLLK